MICVCLILCLGNNLDCFYIKFRSMNALVLFRSFHAKNNPKHYRNYFDCYFVSFAKQYITEVFSKFSNYNLRTLIIFCYNSSFIKIRKVDFKCKIPNSP